MRILRLWRICWHYTQAGGFGNKTARLWSLRILWYLLLQLSSKTEASVILELHEHGHLGDGAGNADFPLSIQMFDVLREVVGVA